MAVTQSAWPFMVPRRERDSDMAASVWCPRARRELFFEQTLFGG